MVKQQRGITTPLVGITTPLAGITTPLEPGLKKALPSFQDFFRAQTISSLLLIFSTVVALSITNSALSLRYEQLRDTRMLVFPVYE